MSQLLRSPILALVIAIVVVVDAALVIAAAQYRPSSWNRQPRLAYLTLLPNSTDRPAGYVDGLSFDGKRVAFAADGHASIHPNGAVDIQGWAFDATMHKPFAAVLLSVDRNQPVPVPYGTTRGDVATVMNCSTCVQSGYRIEFQPHELRRGHHVLHLRFVTPNADGEVDGPSLVIDVR